MITVKAKRITIKNLKFQPFNASLLQTFLKEISNKRRDVSPSFRTVSEYHDWTDIRERERERFMDAVGEVVAERGCPADRCINQPKDWTVPDRPWQVYRHDRFQSAASIERHTVERHERPIVAIYKLRRMRAATSSGSNTPFRPSTSAPGSTNMEQRNSVFVVCEKDVGCIVDVKRDFNMLAFFREIFMEAGTLLYGRPSTLDRTRHRSPENYANILTLIW